jgi:hypothetical protein
MSMGKMLRDGKIIEAFVKDNITCVPHMMTGGVKIESTM